MRAVVLATVLIVLAAGLGGGRVSASRSVFRPVSVDSVKMTSVRHLQAVPTAVRRTASWCGTTSTTDRPPAVTGYPIRVIYAFPADGSDQSATWAPQVSDLIDQITSWWQREDPSRAPRFDVYAAPCGVQLDLQVMQLPGVSVSATDAHQVFAQVWGQLQSQPDAATTKYLVFIDQVNTGNICGVGGPAGGSTLGQPSMGVATEFLQSCSGADHASVAAHELVHAVSPDSGFVGSPHTCPGDLFHVCDSTGDILYPYVGAGIPITSLQLDYNHDDYWAGTAPVNLQVQPWFKHTQDQVHLGLAITGSGTVTSDLPGLDCTASCGSDWDRGDVVNLSPASANGYRFVRWTGTGCTGDADCSLTLDASKDVAALFAPSAYSLSVKVVGTGTVSSNPRGLTCKRGTCSKPFTSYQPVLLNAKPAVGWRFTGWSGACHGKRTTCSVPMSAPSTARAAFAKKR